MKMWYLEVKIKEVEGDPFILCEEMIEEDTEVLGDIINECFGEDGSILIMKDVFDEHIDDFQHYPMRVDALDFEVTPSLIMRETYRTDYLDSFDEWLTHMAKVEVVERLLSVGETEFIGDGGRRLTIEIYSEVE